ncbi:MOV10-like protein [Mya arenaria]|uniref:RNA helicase n=1 Tax=Mya arenaria TaxID=6604 RepID=A0ABY7E784_MYAAR|nr:MOV10-like protein [Mya arenaria]
MNKNPFYRDIQRESDAFVKFLKTSENVEQKDNAENKDEAVDKHKSEHEDKTYHTDMYKRDEMRAIYDYKFVPKRNERVAFRYVIKYLKDVKLVHELGDYFSFAKDIQVVYEKLSTSDEYEKILEKWRTQSTENPYFCQNCGIDCQTEINLEQHTMGNRHRIHKLQAAIFNKSDELFNIPKGVVLFSNPTVVDGGKMQVQCRPEENKCRKDYRGGRMGTGLRASTSLIACFRLKKNALTSGTKLAPARIPDKIRRYVHKESAVAKSRHTETTQRSELRSVLDCSLSTETYKERMKTLLWVEEIQMEIDIKNYDLVPGLAERRPSLMRCDKIQIFIHGLLTVCYIGIVHKVEETRVHLGVDERLVQRWVENTRFDVRFNFSRTNLWVQHRAVSKGSLVWDVLFPSASSAFEQVECFTEVMETVEERESTCCHSTQRTSPDSMPMYQPNMSIDKPILQGKPKPKFTITAEARRHTILAPVPPVPEPSREHIQLKPWYDKKLNEEQQVAVSNIVQGTSRPAPYMIFGPPGTGKTVTVTEAIRQIYHSSPTSRILVCCPENTAADIVMLKLISKSLSGTVQLKDIYRLCAVYRPFASIPSAIKDSKMYNFDDKERDFYYPAKSELEKYRILIVTLNEGAHAIEPECIVPITGLMDATKKDTCPQLVISGDPKQLGPVLRSRFSLEYGHDLSIMERLMRDFEEYQRRDDNTYNVRYITKLVRNYRSHDDIINIPRQLFYDKELMACGDEILNSMLGWDGLPNKKFPIIFHSVFGNDEREEDSPSFFNRKQVQKVRQMISRKKYNEKKGDIMVGSVEEFQGQEFKVIIISTVRSNKSLAYRDIDLQFNLGFLRNPKRFNVAITRARALLIVVGNPITLEQDPHWKSFIDFCDRNGGFCGPRGQFSKRKGGSAQTEASKSAK